MISLSQSETLATLARVLAGCVGKEISLTYRVKDQPAVTMSQASGLIESVEDDAFTVLFSTPLPASSHQAVFTAYLPSGDRLLRFRTRAVHIHRAFRFEMSLPMQVEALQRRKNKRYKVTMPVEFVLTPSDISTPTKEEAMLSDLSLTGCCLSATRCSLLPGQRLQLSIHTPDGYQLRQIEAAVRRVASSPQGQTLGLQFLSIRPAVEAALIQHLLKFELSGSPR